MDRPLTIAVTGMNATENPGPGVGVVRALRKEPNLVTRVVALAYDVLEPGLYPEDLVDDVFVIPYPSQGISALEERLAYVHEKTPLDVIIPTLDSELPSFIELAPKLQRHGIGMFLPTSEQFELRGKSHLEALGTKHDLPVPASAVINDASDLYSIHERVPYPFFVKGVFYGARMARSLEEAIASFHAIVAKWGLPVIIQKLVTGEERDVVAVGDGLGGLVGAVPMKKTYLTDKGKGWAGITIKDDGLLALTRRFMAATHWRGPCEVEVIKEKSGAYQLLEVNPRFPAWCYLSAAAGVNLPAAVARLAAGLNADTSTDYRVGTMFTRISIDHIASFEDFQQIASFGELHRTTPEVPP